MYFWVMHQKQETNLGGNRLSHLRYISVYIRKNESNSRRFNTLCINYILQELVKDMMDSDLELMSKNPNA